MNFISNINPWTTLMGMGLLALSERLKNQDEPVATHSACCITRLGHRPCSLQHMACVSHFNSAPHPRAYIALPSRQSTYSLPGSEPHPCT